MRSVPEWIGKTDDTPVPPRVKLRILSAHGDTCAFRRSAFTARLKPEFDHIIALVNGGQHAEWNLRPVCKPCHRAKTNLDVAEKSKIADIRKKQLGLKTPKKPWPKRHDPWGKAYRARIAS